MGQSYSFGWYSGYSVVGGSTMIGRLITRSGICTRLYWVALRLAKMRQCRRFYEGNWRRLASAYKAVCFWGEIESCLQRRRSCLSRPKATASSLFVCVLADRLLLLSEGKLCFSVCDRSVFTDKLESEISWSSWSSRQDTWINSIPCS